MKGKGCKLRCPVCGSLRVAGTRNHFRCMKCGFKHGLPSSVPSTLLTIDFGGGLRIRTKPL